MLMFFHTNFAIAVNLLAAAVAFFLYLQGTPDWSPFSLNDQPNSTGVPRDDTWIKAIDKAIM